MSNQHTQKIVKSSVANWSLVLTLGVTAIRELLYYFTPQPESLNPIDYVLLAVSIPFLLLAYAAGAKQVKFLVSTILILSVLASFLGQVQLSNNFDIVTSVKFAFPIAFLILALFSEMVIANTKLKILYFILVVCASAGVLRIFGNSSAVNVIEVRHSTAYLLIGVAICIWVSNLAIRLKIVLELLLLIPLLLINVATAIIGFGVFAILESANKLRWRLITRFWLFFAVVISVVYSRVDIFNFKSIDFGLLGSGRVAAWGDGFASFLSHGTYSQIFGQGSGSAFQFWGVWWWAQKDIHSDFLRILIENGLLVFFAVVISFFFLALKFQKTNPRAVAILSSAIATSIISNGVLGRPYSAVLWALAGVISFYGNYSERSGARSDGVFEQLK